MSANIPYQASLQAQQSAVAANQVIATNNALRNMLLASSVTVKQNIFSTVLNNPVAGNNVLNIPFRPVGLVEGFIVKCNVTFSEIHSGDTISLTDWNIANLLSNVTMTDFDNYQRINTAGWHLNMLATDKEQFPHGAAVLLSATDSPVKYGNNFNVVQVTAPTSGATGSAQMYYWVPCAYSAHDLRGALFAGVTNATAFLQLTVNSTPYIDTAVGDPTFAVFKGTGNTTPPTISQITITVYQVYKDQLPRYQSGPEQGLPILPPLDIATQYRLNTTTLTGVAPAQDFPISFTNFQQFLSLGFIYDQAGTVNGGTDLNTIGLAAANTYVPFKVDPFTQAWLSRHKIKTDYPKGSYLFPFRTQPVNTNQTGNIQMLVNAITAATGTTVNCGFEAFALTSQVIGAASLPAG